MHVRTLLRRGKREREHERCSPHARCCCFCVSAIGQLLLRLPTRDRQTGAVALLHRGDLGQCAVREPLVALMLTLVCSETAGCHLVQQLTPLQRPTHRKCISLSATRRMHQPGSLLDRARTHNRDLHALTLVLLQLSPAVLRRRTLVLYATTQMW